MIFSVNYLVPYLEYIVTINHTMLHTVYMYKYDE